MEIDRPYKELSLRHYEALKKTGIQCILKGYFEEGLSNFQNAALLNWQYCQGFFYDDQIETALRFTSRKLFPKPLLRSSVSNSRKTDRPKINVAYILSCMSKVGGNLETQLRLLRYHSRDEFNIRLYSTEFHDSSQGEQLSVRAIREMGIPMWQSPHRTPLVEKVVTLREKIVRDNIDIAILNIYACDVVAIAALLDIPSVTTAYFHHCSLEFNIGVNCFDYHIDYRENFYNFCQDLKNMDQRVMIPLPGPDYHRLDLIKPMDLREIGIPDGATVSVTCTELYKLFYDGRSLFFDCLLEILELNPDHYHVLVTSFWNKKHVSTLHNLIDHHPILKSRLILLEKRPEVVSLLKAANVLLDSFPIGSGNVVLESMACGTPVVVLNDLNLNKYSPYPYSVELTECMAKDTKEYVRIVERFIHDNKIGKVVGGKLRDRFLSQYRPDYITQIYEKYYREWVLSYRLKRPSSLWDLKKSLKSEYEYRRVAGLLYCNPACDPLDEENYVKSLPVIPCPQNRLSTWFKNTFSGVSE